jgi:glucose-1-phosphate cytidylyltransferase
VVILCGGQGTRLRGTAESVAKPLVEIGDRPILWHIMKLYAHYGHRRFILCLGYRSWDIKEYFLTYRQHVGDFVIASTDIREPMFTNDLGNENWEVTCAETGLDAQTGARLSRVRRYIDTDTFMLTYGDGIGSVDIGRLLAFHEAEGRIGTVTGVHPTSKYGEMKVEGTSAVEFNEKPTRPEGYVSAGFFVFRRDFLDYVDDDPGNILEHEPLQKLARDRELAVFPHAGFWMGMDTHRDWLELNHLWRTDSPPWKIWSE